jgi:hypothetical protein
LGAEGKGAFTAGEIYWELDLATIRCGTWARTDEQIKLEDEDAEDTNHGLYAVADIRLGAATWSLRWGLANQEVSRAANFLAAAVEHPLFGRRLGWGLSRTGASNRLENARDTYHAEIYLDFEPTPELHLTPSIQYLKNSGLQRPDDARQETVWLAGLRATYGF